VVVVSGGTARGSNVLEPKARPPGGPSVILRSNPSAGSGERPAVVVRSLAGVELRRYLADSGGTSAKSFLGDIDPEDIAAIEVYKGRAICPASAVPCPQIVITVKRGREAAYRAR
jgi:hypothetical protein